MKNGDPDSLAGLPVSSPAFDPGWSIDGGEDCNDRRAAPWRFPSVGRSRRAFTLLELMVVISLIATLAAMAIPLISNALDAAAVSVAIGDLRTLQTEITRYEVARGKLPEALNQLDAASITDPWGQPYQYLNFIGATNGQKRKDRFLVPINSRYDLYSMGKDGATTPPLTAAKSQDDVIVANDGSFMGLASDF